MLTHAACCAAVLLVDETWPPYAVKGTFLVRVIASPRACRCCCIWNEAAKGLKPLMVRETAAKVWKPDTLEEISLCTGTNAVAPSALWIGSGRLLGPEGHTGIQFHVWCGAFWQASLQMGFISPVLKARGFRQPSNYSFIYEKCVLRNDI